MKRVRVIMLAVAVGLLRVLPAMADWSGVHVGLYGGGAWGVAPATTTASANSNAAQNYPAFDPVNLGAVNSAGVAEVHPSGGTFGGQIGYDKLFGRVLVGVEVDGGYFSTSSTDTSSFRYPDVRNNFIVSQSVSTDWLATARPRVGWVQRDILFYLTGGVAAANFKYNAQFSDNFAASHGLGTALETSATSKNAIGWTVGTGMEFKLVGKLTLKAEYLHADFGHLASSGTLSVNGGAFVNTFTHSVSLSEDMLRIGINRRF